MKGNGTSIFTFDKVGVIFTAHNRRVTVLSDFEIDVRRGERIVLQGKSGAGKTTVLNLMAGFLPPSEGRVRFFGDDLYDLSARGIARFRNRDVGIVHQFFNLIPGFDALTNVAAPLRIAGCSRKKAGEEALQMLDKVGVAARAQHYPREMSGGEQQRVAIARALIRSPQVILADEPTGNLDPATSAGILDLLAELTNDSTTVVVATHDARVAEFGSRIVEVVGTSAHQHR